MSPPTGHLDPGHRQIAAFQKARLVYRERLRSAKKAVSATTICKDNRSDQGDEVSPWGKNAGIATSVRPQEPGYQYVKKATDTVQHTYDTGHLSVLNLVFRKIAILDIQICQLLLLFFSHG